MAKYKTLFVLNHYDENGDFIGIVDKNKNIDLVNIIKYDDKKSFGYFKDGSYIVTNFMNMEFIKKVTRKEVK